MTYTEMYNQIYSSGTLKDKVAQYTMEQTKAWAILCALNERAGFDHWWDRVPDELKDDIFEDIKRIVGEV